MYPESALIAAIQATPSDDVPRRAYADWLGDGDDPRATYLRSELALARLDPRARAAQRLRLRMMAVRARLHPAWLEAIEGPGTMRVAPVPYPTAWMAPSLEPHRLGRGTYEYYAYEALPPLPLQMLAPGWAHLPGSGRPVPPRHETPLPARREVRHVIREAEARGVRLPRSFVSFLRSRELMRAASQSPTDCWLSLGAKLVPAPRMPGCFLLLFFSDSQSCGFWCLLLHPSGGHCVLGDNTWTHGYTGYASCSSDRDLPPPPGAPRLHRNRHGRGRILYYCAPTFSSFLHRLCLESRCWFGLNGASTADEQGWVQGVPPSFDVMADPACGPYLRHYAARGDDASTAHTAEELFARVQAWGAPG